MSDYNYIKVYAEKGEPLYILRMEKGTEDELILVQLFLDNGVHFEKSTLKDYESLIADGGDQYILTSDELIDEHDARGFTADEE